MPETDADTPDTPPEEEPQAPPAETDADETSGAAPSGKRRLFFILCAAVALVAGGAGYGVAVFTAGPDALAPASAEAGETQAAGEEAAETPTEALPEPKSAEETENYAYKDLEPITVNLDEPRLARYVHATVTLAIPQEDFEKASALIDEQTRVLRDWLTVYLTSLTLDDVRGPANLNRIRREILDAFNQELWPEGKPLIRKVLFKEFAVK